MHFSVVFELLAVSSIISTSAANPLQKHESQDEPSRVVVDSSHPEITEPPIPWWKKLPGFPAKQAKFQVEIKDTADKQEQLRRRQDAVDTEFTTLCGANYVVCSLIDSGFCCPSGNVCYRELGAVKCQPVLSNDFSNLNNLGDFSGIYSSILQQYSSLLGDLSLTGSFDYNSWYSSYLSALQTALPSSFDFGNNGALSSLLGGGLSQPSDAPAVTGAINGDDPGLNTTKRKKKAPLGAIIGGVVGGILVLAAICGIIAVCLIKKRKKAKLQKIDTYNNGAPQPYPQPTPGPTPGPEMTTAYNNPYNQPIPPPVSPQPSTPGGYPAVPQPGQHLSTTPYGQNQYPPPAISPPPPTMSPQPYDPSKGYYQPAPANIVEMPNNTSQTPAPQYAHTPSPASQVPPPQNYQQPPPQQWQQNPNTVYLEMDASQQPAQR